MYVRMCVCVCVYSHQVEGILFDLLLKRLILSSARSNKICQFFVFVFFVLEYMQILLINNFSIIHIFIRFTYLCFRIGPNRYMFMVYSKYLFIGYKTTSRYYLQHRQQIVQLYFKVADVAGNVRGKKLND